MKKIIFGLLTIFLVMMLAGCGLGKDNTLPPSQLVNFQPVLQLNALWAQSAGSGSSGYYLRLLPAANNNTIFTASYNGVISAISAQTGKVAWTVSLKENVTSGVAAGNNAVYVGTEEANVYALSQQDGHVLWKQAVSNEVLAPPQYADNTVIIETISGTLTALSAVDGHRIWRFDQSVPSLILHAAGQPQVADGIVVAGFSNGELTALNLKNGRVMWDQHVAYPTGDNPVSQMVDVTVTPVIVGDAVYAATYQGKVSGYNLQTGQELWEHNISSYSGIAASRTQLFVSDASSRVWAFDTDSGEVDWKQIHLLGRQITGPVLYSGNVVVADRYGYLHVLSAQDGHFLGRINLGDGALAQPILYANNLYVYTESGKLIAVTMK